MVPCGGQKGSRIGQSQLLVLPVAQSSCGPVGVRCGPLGGQVGSHDVGVGKIVALGLAVSLMSHDDLRCVIYKGEPCFWELVSFLRL